MKKIIIFLIVINIFLCFGSNTFAKGKVSYMLGPKDVVRIYVWEHPELSGDFTIGPSGEISFLLIGEIMAEGLIAEELKQVLTESLSKFIEEPSISVSIVGYNSKVVYVLGEIARPGEYPMAGTNLTLKQVLYRAGLPTRSASNNIHVITPGEKTPTIQIFNVNKILYRGDIIQDIELSSGDIVYIPPTIPVKIANFLENITIPITRIIAQIFSFIKIGGI